MATEKTMTINYKVLCTIYNIENNEAKIWNIKPWNQ